VGDLIELHDG